MFLKSEGIEFETGKEVRVSPLHRYFCAKFLFAFLLFVANSSLAEETVPVRINQEILPLAGESIIYTVQEGNSLFC